MPFKKGQSGNIKGKPKGAVNKRTKQIEESLELVMSGLASTLLADIQAVNPSRRLQLYTDLMNYIKPKLASNKNDSDVTLQGGIEINLNLNSGLDIDKILGGNE